MEMTSNDINVNEIFKLVKWNALYDNTTVRCTYGEKVAYIMEPSLCNEHLKEFIEMFWCVIHALIFCLCTRDKLGLYERISQILNGNMIDMKHGFAWMSLSLQQNVELSTT